MTLVWRLPRSTASRALHALARTCSGYAYCRESMEPIHDGIAYLQKPFTPDGLGCKVRELFDGPPTAPSAGAESALRCHQRARQAEQPFLLIGLR
jgi:hypothetical protein